MFSRRHYFDYASLTPIDPRVLREMDAYSTETYANPSSWYCKGTAALKALNEARSRVAHFIHAHPDEIIFTSGGTESNNLALLGSIESLHDAGREYRDMHVVVSAIEHSSVMEIASYLKKKGVIVEYVDVDGQGMVKLDDLKRKIKSNTVLVSIMTVNNEVGTIQPIQEIAKSMKYPLFHTDAAQAGYLELNVEKMGVDLLTLDGSKVYGPRGIGALYIKRNTPIAPIIHGGGQEHGMRSGTENIPAIMGFARALDLVSEGRIQEVARLTELRSFLITELKKLGVVIHSEHVLTSPHIINISIPGIHNEFFVLWMDARGINCSTKSSCLRDEDESYVLRAMGVDGKTSIRLSLGRGTKKSHIKKLCKLVSTFILTNNTAQLKFGHQNIK